MEYTFKKFEGKNIRTDSKISLTKSNQLGFTTTFCNDNKVKEFDYINLFWDKEKMALGIHFTNEKNNKSAFSILKSSKYGANVIIRSFLRANKIDPKKYSQRYNWEKQQLEGVGTLYIINLEEKTRG